VPAHRLLPRARCKTPPTSISRRISRPGCLALAVARYPYTGSTIANSINLTATRLLPPQLQAGNALEQALELEAHTLLHGSVTAATKQQYDKHQLYFIRFLALINHLDRVWDMPYIFNHALPLFCAWLCRSCIGDTVKTYMGGTRHFYLLHGLSNPLEGNFRVKAIIKAQQLATPGGKNRKLHITLDMLKIIVHYSNWNDPSQVACICAAIVAFFAFLRSQTSLSSPTTPGTHTPSPGRTLPATPPTTPCGLLS